MNSWHEQDEFWSVFEASIFDETQKVAAPAEVESILRLLAIEPPRTARIFRPRDWHTVGDATVLYERKPIDDWSRIENRWILVKDGRQTEWRFSHRIYAAIELRRLLEDCGFDEGTVYGSFQGALYDEKADRLVVVGRKGSCAEACA